MLFGTGEFVGAATKLDPGEWASGAPGVCGSVVGGVAGPASCDVEVTVRYKAVPRTISGSAQDHAPPQDHISKSGNSGLSSKGAPLHAVPNIAMYVQPLGSCPRSSPLWTLTGIGGCDGNVNTPLLLLSPDAEYPEMAHFSDWMVKQVDVPLMTVGSVPQKA